MALKLLTNKAIEGKVEHLYQHDVESFIWVLTWVSLRYEDGKLQRNGRPLDDWLTVDAKGCYKEKTAFHFQVKDDNDNDIIPSKSHQSAWQIEDVRKMDSLAQSLAQTPGESRGHVGNGQSV